MVDISLSTENKEAIAVPIDIDVNTFEELAKHITKIDCHIESKNQLTQRSYRAHLIDGSYIVVTNVLNIYMCDHRSNKSSKELDKDYYNHLSKLFEYWKRIGIVLVNNSTEHTTDYTLALSR